MQQQAIEELQHRVRRYPAGRYPVQHATAQFHLGMAYVQAGVAERAVEALSAAAAQFDPTRLPLEHAKATNMLGAALRMRGDLAGAADAFARAAAGFEAQDRPKEHGAALFNLGLAQRDAGDTAAAAESFKRALRRFDAERLPGQSSAAARELGAILLADGEADAAADTFQRAMELAAAAGDQAALGAAANALGLAQLAAGRPEEAIGSFNSAVAAHPRTVRPEGYAMAKANLALAYERSGDAPRGRLVARQALATPDAPEPVSAQASATLERLGNPIGDVVAVLDSEPVERWPATVRDEMVAWIDLDAADRRVEAGAWVDALAARPGHGADLAETWLGVLLEQPPGAMEAVIRSTLEALMERDAGTEERFRAQVSRAMPRFPMPQWMRLTDVFNRIAADLGGEPVWG